MIVRRHNDPGRKRVQDNDWLPGFFRGDDVFIVGGGPSLTGFDFSRLDGRRKIVINHSYRYVKNYDLLVFLDSRFRVEALDRGDDPYSFDCRVLAGPCSGMKTQGNTSVYHIANDPSMDPRFLYGRAQSGLVAINAAIIGKARNIYLLGFDCNFQNGQGHFYSKEWKHVRDDCEAAYTRVIRSYEKYRGYTNIINCSMTSALPYFTKANIDDVLCDPSPVRVQGIS